MCFISVGYFFQGQFCFLFFFCYHTNSLTSKFKCAVGFQVSTWNFSAEWNKHKLCKVSSLSDLCTLDIWKWVHCHVMSLSKDSIWWIFHPSCLQNLFCMHTDVHCIKTLSWPAVFLVYRVWYVHVCKSVIKPQLAAQSKIFFSSYWTNWETSLWFDQSSWIWKSFFFLLQYMITFINHSNFSSVKYFMSQIIAHYHSDFWPNHYGQNFDRSD